MKKLLALVAITPLAVTSCGSNTASERTVGSFSTSNDSWLETIRLENGGSWIDMESDWATKLVAEINKVKNSDNDVKDLKDVKIELVNGGTQGDNKVALENLENGRADIAFTNSMSVYRHKTINKGIVPFVQTSTNSFAFSGEGNDNLEELAKKTNEAFNFKNFNTQAQVDEYNKNGNEVNDNFYDFGNPINFYRGAVWIGGSDQNITDIKKAWSDKNWEDFRNFGIGYGKVDSAGGFQSQAALFKDHFGDQFTTLNEEIISKKDNFTSGVKAAKADFADYKIVFDDECSFCWTAPTTTDATDFVADVDNMEVLTVTKALPYDMFSAKSGMNKKQLEIFAKAIQNMADNGEDDWGPTAGYIKYDFITDLENAKYKWYDSVFNNYKLF